MLTYKRKLKLNKSQEDRISSWIGACRVVYNMGLEIKIASYKILGTSPSSFDLMKQLVDIKDVEWIKDVPAQTLQESMDRLDRSYKTFFRTHHNGGGFPRFAKKHRYKSIVIKSVVVKANHTVKIPKLGIVRIFKDSEIIGTPKRTIIIKEPTGFFICIQCENVNRAIQNQDENQVIGIDMGLKHFCVDSNGGLVSNPKYFAKHEARLRIENRSLSRKVKFSNRWKKQAKRLGKLHHKIANVRKDYIHKVSTEYTRNFNTVCVEDLKIDNMARNKNLSKHILDCGWGMFRDMLAYKTNVVRVNPRYTSQKCSKCGHIDSASRVSQSEFVCTCCGHIDHADINAAENVKCEGIAIIRKREALACA